MNWAENIDLYCERTGPGLWAEPLNALSNLAFIAVAVILWRRAGRNAPFDLRLLICLLYTSPSPRDATLSRMPSSA